MACELKCIKCGKESEVDFPTYLQMKRDGLILNSSHRGRVKSINCCSKKAPSRGKPKKEPKPKTPTKKDKPKKESKPKAKPTTTPSIGNTDIFLIEAQRRFPKTLKIDGKVFDYLVHSKFAKQAVEELGRIHKVNARVVQNGTIFAVYVNLKQFKYCNVHVRGSGHVIVYKDWDNPPQKVKIATGKSGSKTVTRLMRVRGTVRDINEELEKKHPNIHRYYKSKVFGLHGRYLVKTYDVFIDSGSTKSPKRKHRLSKDYERWCKLHKDDEINQPHCSDCQNKSCEDSAASGAFCGDDACATRFRM